MMSVYLTLLVYIFLLMLIVGCFRMIAQAFFLKKHMKKPIKEGCIPFWTNIKLHNLFGVGKLNYIGLALRVVGVALMIGTLIWQYYESMVQLTHMYGLLLQTYTPTDYSLLWQIMSWGGIILMVAGIGCRLVTIKRIFKYFGVNSKLMQFLGMVEPTLYYVFLSLSHKARFILDKPTKQMSREEYELYCALSEE